MPPNHPPQFKLQLRLSSKFACRSAEQQFPQTTHNPQDSRTLYAQILRNTECLHAGQILHSRILKDGFSSSIFLQNLLIDMYCRLRLIADARKTFDKMPSRNVFSWNTLIAGYIKGKKIDSARSLFDKMHKRDVVSWNTIIAGYAAAGRGAESLKLFAEMAQLKSVEPDNFTFSSVISGCSSLISAEEGRQVHACAVKSGFHLFTNVCNSLVTTYSKYGRMEDAQRVFEEMRVRDKISWNAIVAAYAQNRQEKTALEMFQRLLGLHFEPDLFTLASVISACSSLGHLESGEGFHGRIICSGFHRNAVVGCSLLKLYTKCGSMEDARKVFQRLPQRDIAVWNAMIAGYSEKGFWLEALQIFVEMMETGFLPDDCSFVCSLSACFGLAVLSHGKQIHALALKTPSGSSVTVNNSLITMYSKCGSIEGSEKLFRSRTWKPNSVTFNAIIGGYAQHGRAEEALQAFEEMLQQKVQPGAITFLSILSACSHAGLVEKGVELFERMCRDYSIVPTIDHFSCMIDMFGRAGRLHDAQTFIRRMPFEPDGCGWASLLGGCRKHCGLELGSVAAQTLLRLQPDNSATYVVAANMYAEAGKAV